MTVRKNLYFLDSHSMCFDIEPALEKKNPQVKKYQFRMSKFMVLLLMGH